MDLVVSACWEDLVASRALGFRIWVTRYFDLDQLVVTAAGEKSAKLVVQIAKRHYCSAHLVNAFRHTFIFIVRKGGS